MFSKILVALDGSEYSDKALEVAVQMAMRCDAQLILFHAVQLKPLRAEYESIVINKKAKDVYRQIGLDQADAIVQVAENAAKEVGLSNVERMIVEGRPASSIVQAVTDTESELVIIGTRGLSALHQITMGSVAHKVTAAASCPVMVVR